MRRRGVLVKGRIFIVGCPRSGTTLLQSLLAAHPQIFSCPETHFFPNTVGSGWRKYLGIASSKARQKLCEFLKEIGQEKMEGLLPSRCFMVRHYVNVFVAILDELTEREGKNIWVEKTPQHLHYIDVVEKCIPDAKFIHLVRNGKDVVASLYDVTHRYPESWGGPRSIEQCVRRWNTDVKITQRYVTAPNHIVVRYEDLVQDPKTTMKKICDFIGVEFTPMMIEQHTRAGEKIILEGQEWVKSAKEPIRKVKESKFGTVFNKWEQAWILDHLEPLGAAKKSISKHPIQKDIRFKEMNVLFLPDGSFGNPYQRELANALKRQGVDVTLSNGIGHLPILGAIRAYGKPDVLHLHWTHGFLVASSRVKTFIKAFRFLTELLIVKFLRIKIVWTVHNLVEHERRHPRLELLFNRILVHLYDQLIVHCLFAQEAVIQTYRLPDRLKAKVNVVPHGHYVDSYENQLSQEEARARLGLGEEKIVFLYFGQIRYYKGVFQLIDAFRKLESPQARLLIVGRPANEAIKTQVVEHAQSDSRILTFLRFVPDKEVQLYMNAADVVVLPYQDILTSGSALLAMSFGKAVIIPNIGCVAEALDSQAAFFYDPNEEEGLLKAMQQALKADLAAMGQHNIDRAKRFNWDKIAQKTVEVYHRCWGRRSAKL